MSTYASETCLIPATTLPILILFSPNHCRKAVPSSKPKGLFPSGISRNQHTSHAATGGLKSMRKMQPCFARSRPNRRLRNDPVFHFRGLLIVCAVVMAAFVSAGVATIQTARAGQIDDAGNHVTHTGKAAQMAFHFPGSSTDPVKAGFGAAVERSYASEVGPSPLPFIQSGFEPFHNSRDLQEDELSPFALLVLLFFMFGGMLTVTITMWRDTGRRTSAIKVQPVARQSRFNH